MPRCLAGCAPIRRRPRRPAKPSGCGSTNGGRVINGVSSASVPATECTAVTSSACSGSTGTTRSSTGLAPSPGRCPPRHAIKSARQRTSYKFGCSRRWRQGCGSRQVPRGADLPAPEGMEPPVVRGEGTRRTHLARSAGCLLVCPGAFSRSDEFEDSLPVTDMCCRTATVHLNP